MMKKIFLAVALTALARTSQAQMAPPSTAIPNALADVHTGALLRVRAQRENVEGRYSGLTSEALVLGITPGNQRPIDFDDITDIWKRESNWKRGAIIGGIAGAIVVSSVVVAIGKAACEQPDGCSGDVPILIGFGTLIGGGGGALVGGGIGYLAKRWEKVY
jgi:hypothetical protein